MFLLVSARHVGAHTDGHQHGVSIQISINLGKKIFRISRIRKIVVTRILARVFAYLPSFISQILDFICWPVLIFILIYFELRDTENQQLIFTMCETFKWININIKYDYINIHILLYIWTVKRWINCFIYPESALYKIDQNVHHMLWQHCVTNK